jgi:hypothetical protein
MSKNKGLPWDAAWAKIARDRFGIGAPQTSFTGSPEPDATPAVPDQAYIGQTAANQLGYANVLNQLPGLLNRASAEYGYKVDYTPGSGDVNDPGGQGSYSIGGVDPSNPNSRAALLQRSYENQQRGNTNSLAARGQLYSGALQNAQDTSAHDYQANEAGNQRSFQDLLAGYFGNVGNARTSALQGNATAFGDLATRLSSVPAPSTVTYAGVPYAPGTTDQPFASPVGRPTPESVLASKSLLGTDITKRPPASYYRPKKGRGTDGLQRQDVEPDERHGAPPAHPSAHRRRQHRSRPRQVSPRQAGRAARIERSPRCPRRPRQRVDEPWPRS